MSNSEGFTFFWDMCLISSFIILLSEYLLFITSIDCGNLLPFYPLIYDQFFTTVSFALEGVYFVTLRCIISYASLKQILLFKSDIILLIFCPANMPFPTSRY